MRQVIRRTIEIEIEDPVPQEWLEKKLEKKNLVVGHNYILKDKHGNEYKVIEKHRIFTKFDIHLVEAKIKQSISEGILEYRSKPPKSRQPSEGD